jgi:hypothetical protein
VRPEFVDDAFDYNLVYDVAKGNGPEVLEVSGVICLRDENNFGHIEIFWKCANTEEMFDGNANLMIHHSPVSLEEASWQSIRTWGF